MNARIAQRNLRLRLNLARYAAAVEARLIRAAKAGPIFPAAHGVSPLAAGREFVFFIRHERLAR